jgi:hypothetical protein
MSYDKEAGAAPMTAQQADLSWIVRTPIHDIYDLVVFVIRVLRWFLS